MEFIPTTKKNNYLQIGHFDRTDVVLWMYDSGVYKEHRLPKDSKDTHIRLGMVPSSGFWGRIDNVAKEISIITKKYQYPQDEARYIAVAKKLAKKYPGYRIYTSTNHGMFLIEKVIVHKDDRRNFSIKYLVNPTLPEVSLYMEKHENIRIIIDPDTEDMYVWNSYDETHAMFAEKILQKDRSYQFKYIYSDMYCARIEVETNIVYYGKGIDTISNKSRKRLLLDIINLAFSRKGQDMQQVKVISNHNRISYTV